MNQDPPSAQLQRPEAPEHLVKLCTRLMQKDPTQRPQHAKAVYTALHNQSSLHLLGSEKVLRGVKTWTTSHHTSLVLLYGHQGMGTKACFKHLIEHHQKLGWEIHLGYTVPPVSEKKKMLVVSGPLEKLSTSFFSEIQQRVLQDEPLTILINTVDKWKAFGQQLSIPKKAFALHPLSPTQIQQLLQPSAYLEKAIIVSSRLHTLYKGRIEYIQEVLQSMGLFITNVICRATAENAHPSSQTCYGTNNRS